MKRGQDQVTLEVMDTVTCILTDNPDHTPAEPGVISVYAPAVLEIADQFHVDLASLPLGG